MPPPRSATEGSLRQRLALHRAARRAGATLRRPVRLPHADGDRPAHRITFGDGAFVGPNAWLTLAPQGSVHIGEGAAIAADLSISAGGPVRIGAGCLFSRGVTIVDQQHDVDRWVARARAANRPPRMTWDMTTAEPVTIGDGTWLGVGVVVLPGVTIGQGCAIGANAVVTQSIPDFTVAAGVPARPIRATGVSP
jgi:acetyltransferase-like isoleucine patch superfamily enzyme